MTAMSNYLENKLIDHILRSTSFSAPSNIYVGLVGKYDAAQLEAGTLLAVHFKLVLMEM